jgi:hypothetical protein
MFPVRPPHSALLLCYSGYRGWVTGFSARPENQNLPSDYSVCRRNPSLPIASKAGVPACATKTDLPPFTVCQWACFPSRLTSDGFRVNAVTYLSWLKANRYARLQ